MRCVPELTTVLLMAALASCGGASMDRVTGGGGDGDGGGGDGSKEVAVVNNSFDPTSIMVTKGTVVTWSWAAGSSNHSVTFDDGVTSATMSTGSFSRKFDAVGAFPYHCKVHGLSMSGRVVVQ